MHCASIGGRDPIRFGLSWVKDTRWWLERGSVSVLHGWDSSWWSRLETVEDVCARMLLARPCYVFQGWLTMVC